MRLTLPLLSSRMRVREGDTGLQIESPESLGSPLGDSLEAGSASIEWEGATNVAPKKIMKPQPDPWRCPNCQIWIARYWTACDGCGHPRIG